MKIVGHRGAAELVTENTLESIKKAMELGVDYVEFDVRLSKDNQLVLHHDPGLKRLTGIDRKIADLSLAEIQNMTTKSGFSIPSLEEVLGVIERQPAFIEIKSLGSARYIAEVLTRYPAARVRITSFKHEEAVAMSRLRPDLLIYAASRYNPFAALKAAKRHRLAGVTLHWSALNPLTYWLAKRYKLSVMVYTVNSRLHARLIRRLYPSVLLCTNFPNRFMGLKGF